MAREENRQRGETGMARRQYQDPFSLMDAMFERMQRDFFGPSFMSGLLPSRWQGEEGGEGQVRVPRMEMHDSGDAIELTAELPGIDPQNVHVECEENVVTIRGESSSEEQREGTQVRRRASFYRQIALPEGVDTEQGQASFRHGMLTLRFPRRSQRANARQIPISTETAGQEDSARKGRAA